MQLAAHIGAWGARWPGSGFGMGPAAAPAGVPPVSFPGTQQRARVEIMLAGVWIDVSSRVLYDDKIVISRGRRPNQRKSTAATCVLTFRNDDRRFAPRYVAGDYFGLLRQNTPLRVWVNPGSGDALRFTGKVPAWEPVARGHPSDRDVTVTAFGVRNRLERPDNPLLESAQKRYLGSLNTQSVLSYRSLEDGSFPRRVVGPPGSGDLPDLSGGGVASDNVLSGWRVGGGVSWAVEIDALYPLDKGTPASYASALHWNTDGNLTDIVQWHLFDDTTGVGLIYNTSAGANVFLQSTVNAYDGLWHHYRVNARQVGADISITLLQDGTSILTTTIVGKTLGAPTFWLVQDTTPALGAERMPAVGHVVFYLADISGSHGYDAFTGWADEAPTARFARLCTEEGLAYDVEEGIVDQILMGPQRRHTLVQLLEECEAASEGLIDENLAGELRLSTLRCRYNREVALTLDYAAGDVLPPLLPADDDEQLRNRWTLDRQDGGTETYALTSGPLNTSEPEDDPLGVGDYGDGDTVNVNSDEALYVSAGWRVHRDTADQPRYPLVKLQLAKIPELIPAWLACDIGSRVVIANGPDDVGPDDPDLVLEGYEEIIDLVSWEVGAYLEPASVYMVGMLGETASASTPSTVARLDCGASVLSSALDTSTTSVALTVTDNCVWTHDFGDYPVTIGGEDVMVTAVSAAAGTVPSQTQTLTVTRGVNGAALAHAAGTAVHVKYPIILAR